MLAILCGLAAAMPRSFAQRATPTPKPAAAAAAIAAEPTASNLKTIRLPIRRLIGAREPIYLQNASSTFTIFLPISPRTDVKSCKLRLVFTNSIALLSERSVLRVVLNDRVIGQFHLTRDQPNHAVDVEIPLKFLDAGSNQVQFVVAQHYTLECEDPAAPELWTQILPDESYFEAVVAWKSIYPKLSLLRDLIDQKLWEPYRLHIAIPAASGTMSNSHLSWGSIISQGAALTLDYRPLALTTGTALLAGVDNVVVGTMNELTPYLTSTEIGAINGSFIAVKQLAGDPSRFLLVISGTNEDEVAQAAYAFSLINFPLPDSQFAQVKPSSFPEAEFYVRNAPLRAPGIYSFRQIGMEKSETVKGWNTGSFPLEVYMPGNLSADDGSNIEMRLHFAYGAAFRADSVLNIFVNKEFQYAIRLDDARGASHFDHRVYLPVKAFQPGRNVVDISPKMVPLINANCDMRQIENLYFTLFRDSDFVLPRLGEKTRLPSFGVFSQTAFPFTSTPNGSNLAVLITGQDNATVSAAWMLLGKMSQINGSVLHRAEITSKVPKANRNLLVVGPVDSIPDEVLAKAPVSPKQVGNIRYLVSVSPKPEATAIGPIEELLEKLRGQPAERSEPEDPATVDLAAQTELLDDTVAIAWESPFHRGKQAAVFTAADSKTLYRGLYNLQDRLFWDNLAGNLVVWGTTPHSLATAQLGPNFLYGVESVAARATDSVTTNPWLFPIIVFGAIGLLAFLLRMALKRREKTDDSAAK